MASFVSFAPPPVYGLLPSQHHGAQFEEHVPTDDEDSGYGSEDYDFVRPSLIDPLGFRKGINPHDHSVLSPRQTHHRGVPLIRHVTPFTRPDHDYIRSGPGVDDGSGPQLGYHEHRSRVPAGLPSLSNRVQSNTDDSSSGSSPRHSSPVTHTQRRNRSMTRSRSPARPARTRDASNQTSNQDPCDLHDRHLAAEWRKLYQESRRLERQRAALMSRQDAGRIPYRRGLTDGSWAPGTRSMSVSDDGMGAEVVVDLAGQTQRHDGRGRKSSRVN